MAINSYCQVQRIQLDEEKEKSRVLQESLRVLAQEQLVLERSFGCRSPSVVGLHSEPDEFFDCEDDGEFC